MFFYVRVQCCRRPWQGCHGACCTVVPPPCCMVAVQCHCTNLWLACPNHIKQPLLSILQERLHQQVHLAGWLHCAVHNCNSPCDLFSFLEVRSSTIIKQMGMKILHQCQRMLLVNVMICMHMFCCLSAVSEPLFK